MTSRRNFLKNVTAAGTIGAMLPGLLTAQELDAKRPSEKKRALRIAHITDSHILDKPQAEAYLSQVLKEINTLNDRPDLIINTGDTVMDENKQTMETVQARWASWNKIVGNANKFPLYSALGNHDVWYGPDEKLDAQYRKDKRYGKQWAIQELGLPSRYYSFTRNGWLFIALDSINGDDGYQLDDEQFEWLKKELESAGKHTPVCIFNHVPILSIGALLYYTKRKPIVEVKFPSGDMHNDHQRIKDLFYTTGNVKICLSGHVHYIDTVEYLGVKYLCSGAVSGNWWGTPLALDEFPPVYTIIDLFSDGTTGHHHLYYSTNS